MILLRLRIASLFSILLLWIVKAQNPPCYLCGGDPSATISNPDFVLDLTVFGDNAPVPNATCAQILQGAIAGLLTAEQCNIALVDARGSKVQAQCGCSTVSAGSSSPGSVKAPTSTLAPVAVVASPVVLTPSPITVAVPSSVTPSPITVAVPSSSVTAAPGGSPDASSATTTAPINVQVSPVFLTSAPVTIPSTIGTASVAPVIGTLSPLSVPVKLGTLTNALIQAPMIAVSPTLVPPIPSSPITLPTGIIAPVSVMTVPVTVPSSSNAVIAASFSTTISKHAVAITMILMTIFCT